MTYLSDLRVVELPGNPAVGFCGRLFANLGARVTKLQARSEDPHRLPVDELAFRLFVDCDKDLRTCDLETAAGRRSVAELCSRADVVLAADPPPWLPVASEMETAGEEAGQVVLALITDFGADSPYAGFRGGPLLGHAAGGYLYLNGNPDREPLRGLPFQPYAQTGLSAFLAVMAALLERRRSGKGQVVSTSVMQTIAACHDDADIRYSHGGIIPRRLGNRYAVEYPIALFPTRDGHIAISIADKKRSDLLLTFAGHPEAAGDPRFASGGRRSVHAADYAALIAPWFAASGNAELMAAFEPVRLAAAPVATLDAVLREEHFRERDFWRELELADDRRVTMPGLPAHPLASSSGTPGRGLRPGDGGEHGPLAGLRVLDLTAGWAGPHATRLLGDLGADVVLVEAPWARGMEPMDEVYARESGYYPAGGPGERFWMSNGVYNKWAYNKRCVALRLDRTEGREVLQRLIRWADVVVDNFSTQAWEQLGLDPESLLALNPAVVAVTMPGYGRWGPAKYRVSYGNQIEAAIGAVSMMGYQGAVAHMFAVAWPDPCAAMHAAACALAGIWQRERDGGGICLELSQAEAALSFIGPEVVRFSLTGETPPRVGNAHERYAPHGVYRCRGDDRWLALAITSDEEWRALCRVIGREDLAGLIEPERREARDSIDAVIAGWALDRDYREAMYRLQEGGVPAFAVYDMRDVVEDEFLRSVSAFVEVGGETLTGFPFRLSRTPPRVHRPVPDIGEHNGEVLAELAYASDEIQRLYDAGVIAREPAV